MNTPRLRLILSEIRSSLNVGAILRTADATGVELVYACGYTPYPQLPDDTRPPHVSSSNTISISKTALGAEATVPILHCSATTQAVAEARREGFKIIVLEQSENSLNLYRFEPEFPLALLVGNEVTGVPTDILTLADAIVELPMLGRKESLNVASATAVSLYQLRFGAIA
jgi:23S rRNA (guanosine2251-2'-O)-methyltransferase